MPNNIPFNEYTTFYLLIYSFDNHWISTHFLESVSLEFLWFLSSLMCFSKPWFCSSRNLFWASLVTQMVKNLPAMQKTQVQSLGREDPLEKEMSIHSSTLAWKIPWTVAYQASQTMGSQRVGHDWVTFPPSPHFGTRKGWVIVAHLSLNN